MLRVHLTYGICVFAFICCTSSQGILTATNITGYGGETTTFTCSSPDIAIGNSYTLLKDTIPIYASTSEGQIVNEKYNASAVNGEIKLNILNTNISDAGKYSCNHNFVDASGYVSVAFRPENIIAVATMFNNGLLLTATATKVFPSDSAISNVTCIKPDKMVAVLQSVGNAVNSNSDIPYLYDISWNGTTTELLAGRVQCTVTLVTVETFDTTIFVSIEVTLPPTLSTTTQIIQNTTDLTPDVCWCKITPWWWCIILIIFASIGGVGVGTLGYWKYKGEINLCGKPRKWPCGSGNKSDGSDGTENLPLSTTVETTNETKSLQSTKHDGYQVNKQVLQTEGSFPSSIKTGHSKVGPDDNQRSADPEKNTAGSIREVNNESINTLKPLSILPKIGSKESRQAPNMDDVESKKPKKKKKKKKGIETKEDQTV